MNREDIDSLISGLAPAIAGMVKSAVAPLQDRIKALENRPLPRDGKDGRDGIDGKDGRDGIDGKDGAPGEKGMDGRDAPTPAEYDDAPLRTWVTEQVKALTAYDDTEIRTQLKELAEHVPKDGKDGQDGVAGSNGADGVNGRDGKDGRDALQLEVLPAIDESKNYPRGTYAKHAGGLWRSFEQTHGMRGWECIVEGVAGLEVEMVDKTLSVRARMSSGAFAELAKELPIQIYRGVFCEQTYHQGDTVTWAGSLWHCNKSGTPAKPGDGSPDWTLAVKKGRDGREIVKTERLQQPVQIGGEA